MLKIEARQMYRSNGLIDDLVVYGIADDYVRLSERIEAADVLRVAGPEQPLKKLSAYFQDVSARSEGYSHIRRQAS